jgi:hypothetical protein
MTQEMRHQNAQQNATMLILPAMVNHRSRPCYYPDIRTHHRRHCLVLLAVSFAGENEYRAASLME